MGGGQHGGFGAVPYRAPPSFEHYGLYDEIRAVFTWVEDEVLLDVLRGAGEVHIDVIARRLLVLS